VTTCSTASKTDAPHGVQQEDEKSPERNELETALGELSWPGASWWQREQRADEPLRERTEISMLF
jgi:hypothetical protein